MTLASNIDTLAARIAEEIVAVRSENHAVHLPQNTSRLSPTGAAIAGLLVPVYGASTIVVAAGEQLLTRICHSGQLVTWLALLSSANNLTSGQGLEVGCFAEASIAGPGELIDMQTLVLGTTIGTAVFSSGVSLQMPRGLGWLSLLNPSGNSGSVTLRSGTLPQGGQLGSMQNSNWGGLLKRTAVASTPSDLTSIVIRSAITSNEMQVDVGNTFPVIGART